VQEVLCATCYSAAAYESLTPRLTGKNAEHFCPC
jgi:hypothetical protein